MLNNSNIENIINEYLSECWTEPTTELYDYVESEYQQLIDNYGANKIKIAIEACIPHMISDENEQWIEASKKLNKKEIFEINTKLGFICGISEAELKRFTEKNSL